VRFGTGRSARAAARDPPRFRSSASLAHAGGRAIAAPGSARTRMVADAGRTMAPHPARRISCLRRPARHPAAVRAMDAAARPHSPRRGRGAAPAADQPLARSARAARLAAQEEQVTANEKSPEPRRGIEIAIERTLFASRWLLAPIYLGL